MDESSSALRFFIDEYVNNTFLPHIKSDYKKRAEVSIEGLEAFKPRDKQKPLPAGINTTRLLMQVRHFFLL